MKKKIVHIAADFLSRTPWFAGGENAPYTLYACVPSQFITRGSDAPVPPDGEPAEEDGIIDLLICEGGGREAVLAVLFGDSMPIDGPLKDLLDRMNHLFFYTQPAPSSEDAEKTCAQLLAYVDSRLRGAGAAQPGVRPALPTVPVKDLTGGGKAQRKRMVKARLLSESSAITEYGGACGLFYQYTGPGSRRLMLTAGEAERFRAVLSQDREKPAGKASLAKRLERLERHQPSDSLYSKHLAALLRQLLDTPLEDFCTDGAALKQNLACIEASMGNIPRPERGLLKEGYTYRDALAAVRSLHRVCMANPDAAERWYTIKKDTLSQLAEQFVLSWDRTPDGQAPGPGRKQPLSARLGQFRNRLQEKYPIACQPVSVAHYCCAAAELAGNDYPNWLYRTQIRTHLDLKKLKEDNLSLVFAAYKNPFDFPFLYNLLVEPVFADADTAFSAGDFDDFDEYDTMEGDF